MGLTQSMTPQEKREHVNLLHENIESIMKLKSRQMSHQERKFVIHTYRSLMQCMFHEQITNAKLQDCLHEHINNWTELNGLIINKDKYVTEKYSHLKHHLAIYFVEVVQHDY